MRTNTSIMIPDYGILIDCSKNFYTQFYTFLKKYKTPIKTVLLTHEHADAIGGLDTLKQAIPNNQTLPIYAHPETIDYLKKKYAYYFESYNHEKSPGYFIPYTIDGSIEIENLKITPIPVDHGFCATYGYRIGNLVYLSDCKKVDSNFILNADVLIVDCNSPDQDALGHMNFIDVVDLVRRIQPRRTIIVGMTHSMDIDNFDELKKEYGADDLQIDFGYDLMEIEVNE